MLGSVTYAGQSDDLSSENSSVTVQESVKSGIDRVEKSVKLEDTVSQHQALVQDEKGSKQSKIKKTKQATDSAALSKVSRQSTSALKSEDHVSKDDVKSEQQSVSRKVVATDADTSGSDVPQRSIDTALIPKAKNVDLEKPIREIDILLPEANSTTNPEKSDKTEQFPELVVKNPAQDDDEKADKIIHDKPFLLLGAEVPPGTSTRLSWQPSQSFQGIAAPTPVLVVNGVKPGPVLCLTAAVHGDELNGIEIVRRVLYNLEVAELSGTVIGVPIVNLQGFRRNSRYLPDRRDLNRFFPGDPKGSSAARIAYSFFHEIISKCDVLVDLHTGSFHRTNLPQLRADLSLPDVVDITQGFGATVIIQSKGADGTLRRAAVNAGIPAVTLEAGEPMRLQEDQVSHGVKGIQTLMNKLGMYDYSSFWGDPEPVYYKSEWVRANQGGILFSVVGLGEKVKPGELLGTITDPITNVRSKLISPYNGRVIGMALNQVVMPGFAVFHVGIKATEKDVKQTSESKSGAEDNHTSEVTAGKLENVAKNKKKISELDENGNMVDSE